jgi:hypothetical protein
MKIIIERSTSSLITHLLHLAMFVLMVYSAFIKYDPFGYIVCAMWVVCSYVYFMSLTVAKAKLQMIENDVARKIMKGFEQFMKDNKDELIKDMKEKDVTTINIPTK